MNDMSQVIIPKSDQLNAEDFLAGPRTYRIEHVDIRAGTEQPVTIQLAGEQRAWKPCKSMSRVLVAAWGPDANAYIGRSVTLYLDPKVKWGGLEVGGIRVSHLSHMERDMSMALTATKGKRAMYVVKRLAEQEGRQQQSAPERSIDDARRAIQNAADMDDLKRIWSSKAMAPFREELQADLDAKKQALAEFPLSDENPAAAEGRDEDHGDQFDGDDQ